MIDKNLLIAPIPADRGRGPYLSPERWESDIHPALGDAGYRVDEFTVAGNACVYTPDRHEGDPRGRFTTRALVIRPDDAESFSGVIHLELLNPSTGEDFPMFWPDAGFHLMDRGDVYIGLTCKSVTTASLRDRDPDRYSGLHIDHDSVIWDLLGSVAYQTHQRDAGGLLPGIGTPRRRFATGWSQAGSFLRTYLAEGIHTVHTVELSGSSDGAAIIDGYLIGVSSGGFGPMGYVELERDGEIAFDMDLMPQSDNAGQIAIDDQRRIIRNAPVPVIEYMSEDESTHHIWHVRHDSDEPGDLYRCYQIPGRGHESGLLTTAQRSTEEALYDLEVPQFEDPPRHESSRWMIAATIDHLVAWSDGVVPPRAERIRFTVGEPTPDPDGLRFGYVSAVTDEFGHALGGLRHLEVDIPTARWSFERGTPAIVRSWRSNPLTREELESRYGDLNSYEERVRARVEELVAEGSLLPQHSDSAVASARDRFESAPESSPLHDWYLEYLSAFNRGDFEALKRYLAPDVVFEWHGVMDDLIGRDAFFDFYRLAWSHFDEHLEARIISAGEDKIVAWIENDLTITRDWIDSPIEPYRAGEKHHVEGEVTYHLRDGQIVRIV